MTRAEAKAAGLLTYQPDKPCKNGHRERWTSGGHCTQCHKEYRESPGARSLRLVRSKDPEKRAKKRAYQTTPEYRERRNKRQGLRHSTPEYRAKRGVKIRRRRKEDAHFRLRHMLKNRVNRALRGRNKTASTMKLVGCTIEHLRAHLEKTMPAGHDWSTVHVDHIRPCASFDLRDPKQQRACFNWRNLRLLPAVENMSKNSVWKGRRWLHRDHDDAQTE